VRESEEMTPRERIRSTLHFKKVDVLPWYESFAIDTVLRWFTEGLPIAETAKVEWRVRWARNFLN